MKYIKISSSDTLSDLTERVGVQNVDQILSDNNLPRIPKIGKAWDSMIQEIKQTATKVTAQQKLTLLNKFVDNADIYEYAALLAEDDWKVLAKTLAFSSYLYISSQIADSIPDSEDMLGNGESIAASIYSAVTELLKNGEDIDSSLFVSYSTIRHISTLTSPFASSEINPMSWFNMPIDEIALYSSISDAYVYIPAYPEQVSDSRSANYTQMPDLLYQYEPWQLYQSSGPRSNTYEFHLHRDMWTGDHGDGKANELIRFCQAQCYPQYNGSAVHTPTVTLYVGKSKLITGVMTQVDVDWGGPIGVRDGWYLEFTLRISITEVSDSTLNYNTVMQKSLIG